MSSLQDMGNDILGKVLGEMGGGQSRIDAHGNLVYENVQGLTRALVKDLLGGGGENAMTIGHVILNSTTFEETTTQGAKWLAHEDAHVRQSEVLGPAYLPVYGVFWLSPGQQHETHPMEAQANEYRDWYWGEYQR